MDDRRFDHLTRALGGASTRRSALAALAGLAAGAGLAGQDADAKKKRRKKCTPACASGQTCVKGTCACDDGGTACGASCCAIGQRCQAGQCGAPEPPACIVAGERCKNAGRPCCTGTVCASGQGGQDDIACYIPAGGACETTAECVFDSTCTGGVCVANDRPQPVPAADCTVCASGCPYSTIEAAIAAAAPGAVITVAAGTYVPAYVDLSLAGGVGIRDYLLIRRPLTLKACVAGEAVVVSCPEMKLAEGENWATNCIEVSGTQGVTLEGLTVQGPGGSSGMVGVDVDNGARAEIRNCAITGVADGVVVSTATATIAGTLSVSDTEFGLISDDASASIVCAAGSSVTFASSVQSFCDGTVGTITDCPCS